jgi:hypothetical protein
VSEEHEPDAIHQDAGHHDASHHDTEWYWDLNRKLAVPASERGPGDHTLGPYPSKAEAENWRATVEARNEGWDDDDEAWEHGERSE